MFRYDMNDVSTGKFYIVYYVIPTKVPYVILSCVQVRWL